MNVVYQYLNHILVDDFEPPSIEKPIRTSDMQVLVAEFYANLMEDLSDIELLNLIKAATFLDIKELLSLATCKVATMLFGKTAKEVREYFRIEETGFTKEEEGM